MPRETKANHATVEARVNKVYDLLLSGATRYQLWKYTTGDKGKELFQGVSQRQLNRYIAEANALIASEAAAHREHGYDRAISRLNDLYARSLKVQDIQRALAVQRELDKLLGLTTPDEPPAAPITVQLTWPRPPDDSEKDPSR